MNTSQSTATAALHVDHKKLVHNLRLAFTDKCSFIQELAQNGRRAGASSISIDFNKPTQSLTITDDGIGIADMGHLLSVAVSGWDDKTTQQEHPYGMGFLSVLYQAKKVTVSSRGKQLSAMCSTILAFEPISIVNIKDDGYTRIELEGIETMPEHLERLFAGFPIPVLINGKAAERYHALDSSDFVDINSGKLKQPSGESALSYHFNDGFYYYQGFCVQSPDKDDYWGSQSGRVVVHIDESQYEAVLPDRRCLINHKESIAEIYASVKPIRIQVIENFFQSISDEECCRYFEKACHLGIAHLFNPIDLYPASLHNVHEYPIYSLNHEGKCYGEHTSDSVSRSDVESGKVTLLDMSLDYEVDEGFNLEMYLYYINKVYLVDSNQLDKGHWAIPHLKTISANELRIELQNASTPNILPKHYRLCESYAIHGPLGTAKISHEASLLNIENNGDCQLIKLIPAGECSGELVLQTECFQGEYNYDDTYEHNERERLASLISQERLAHDIPALFKTHLSHTLPQALNNRLFKVAINDAGAVDVQLTL